MTDRIIHSDACVAEGAAWLAQRDTRLALALEQTGPLPLRRRPGGFAALLRTICGQQLSVASAGACWARLAEAGAQDPAVLQAMDDAALAACGLSRPKIRYARALAEADLNYDLLAKQTEDAAIAELTAVTGIGTWTAEIYLMFSVGRADVFAAGDLALQEAARLIFGLPERPAEKDLRALAEDWSPWRSVAARLLWAYYRVAKQREGITE